MNDKRKNIAPSYCEKCKQLIIKLELWDSTGNVILDFSKTEIFVVNHDATTCSMLGHKKHECNAD